MQLNLKTYLILIKCDGANVNIGYKGGAIRCLEMFLKRPLQWVICELHHNEVPLRHIGYQVLHIT